MKYNRAFSIARTSSPSQTVFPGPYFRREGISPTLFFLGFPFKWRSDKTFSTVVIKVANTIARKGIRE